MSLTFFCLSLWVKMSVRSIVFRVNLQGKHVETRKDIWVAKTILLDKKWFLFFAEIVEEVSKDWIFKNIFFEILQVQSNLDFTYLEFTINFEFTLKGLVTKIRIYSVKCLNSTLYLDFKSLFVLTNNIVKSRLDCTYLKYL